MMLLGAVIEEFLLSTRPRLVGSRVFVEVVGMAGLFPRSAELVWVALEESFGSVVSKDTGNHAC